MKRTIELGTKCTTCDKRIGVFESFTPSLRGIRHTTCLPGEWVTEHVCTSCAAPVDPDEPDCDACGATTAIEHREWRCGLHDACFCWPEVA